MAVFQKGNRFWEMRSSHGRNPTFKTPDALWDAACEYFAWCEDNPLYEQKAFHFQGEVIVEPLAKMRAFTEIGLCLFLDISDETLRNYKKNTDFFGVISNIERTIYKQKFEGAAADLLNANIISRELGLASKQDITTNGESINKPAIDTSKLTDEQLRSLDTILSQASETGTIET